MHKIFLCCFTIFASCQTSAAAPAPGIAITEGSGVFDLQGGIGHEDDTIRVHYYKPRSFTPRARVLIVLAGAGRDGDEYRDSWIATADRHGILVLAPSYAEKDYDLGDYHFGGIIDDIELRNVRIDPGTEIYRLNDEDILFRVETDARKLLFHDFDRLFAVAKVATRSRARGYDLFGHSAGGQILHRFALFHARSKAQRIVAANAGFYTVPTFDVPLPLGLRGTTLSERDVDRAFTARLVVLVGELDNEHETRGIHLRTPMADRQGIGRFARGRYFFATARDAASRRHANFNWQLEVVPGVGHDQRAMSVAAARILYGD